MKVIVYSTNLNSYDDLHETPEVKFNMQDDFEYLYYTDTEAPKGWTKIDMTGESRKESRFYKINSHFLPDHDISIYIDANLNFQKGITNFPDFVADHDVAIAKHGKDNNIYEHVGTCSYSGKDEPKRMMRQVAKYINEGLPDHTLTENCIIVRKNNKRVRKMNEIWWQEYLYGSERDQLSLPYAIWKSGAKLTLLPFSARENEYLTGWNTHKPKELDYRPQDSPLWEELKNDIIKNIWS